MRNIPSRENVRHGDNESKFGEKASYESIKRKNCERRRSAQAITFSKNKVYRAGVFVKALGYACEAQNVILLAHRAHARASGVKEKQLEFQPKVRTESAKDGRDRNASPEERRA